jgi:hypothetical protein
MVVLGIVILGMDVLGAVGVPLFFLYILYLFQLSNISMHEKVVFTRAGNFRYNKRYLSIRYLVNTEKISKIADLKSSSIAGSVSQSFIFATRLQYTYSRAQRNSIILVEPEP